MEVDKEVKDGSGVVFVAEIDVAESVEGRSGVVDDDVSVGRDEKHPMGFEYFSSEGINLVVDLGELCDEEFNSTGVYCSGDRNQQCVDVDMEGVGVVVDLSDVGKECKDERLDFDDGGAVGERFYGYDYVLEGPLLDERVNVTDHNQQSDAKEVEKSMANSIGLGVNNNQSIVFDEEMTCARLDGKGGDESDIVAVTPEVQSEDCLHQKDVGYNLADLVWGKVRGHPWWPGQIFDPSAASTLAKKRFKEGAYLVAYFGDQTFAWNEPTTLKPFHTHYVRMAKQSNMEDFCQAVDCALQEVSRRVEYGLSCSCLPLGQLTKIESQAFTNTDIQRESSKRNGIGESASSFASVELLQDLELLAADPFHQIDKLRFVTVKAQLSAFNHWKRFTHLPDSVEFDGLGDGDDDIHTPGKKSSMKMLGKGEGRTQRAIQDVSYLKYKHISDVVVSSESERKSVRSRGMKKKSLSTSAKTKLDKSVSSDLRLLNSQTDLSSCNQKGSSSRSSKYVKVGERARRVSSQLSEPRPALESGVESSQIVRGSIGDNSVNAENVSPPEEILSKLCLSAVSPMKGYGFMKSFISFLSYYRNTICLEHKNRKKRKRSSGEQSGEESSKLEERKMYEFEGVEDSYWTDKTIQSNLEEQEILESYSQLGAENHNEVGENSEDYTPTELILKFSDLDSVPSITELNKIFSQYGPLDESQSAMFSKSKRAKVVFKRRSHAETAFSKAGKFRIFGLSLLGYCLKASTCSARTRKAAKSASGK